MLSVIIPIYNVSAYLRRCLDSVLRQTYAQWEAILINDGSTDNSGEIANEYVQKDARFMLLHQTNQGQSAARNRGIERAQGEYILFIDADDAVAPNYFAFLLSHIQDADLLQTGYKRMDNSGKVLEQKCPTSSHPYLLVAPWGRLYKRSFLLQHNLMFKEGIIYEDVLFSAQLWQVKPTIKVVAYYGYYYYVNPSSTTSRPHRTAFIHRSLKQLGLHLWSYDALRLRLIAHFIKSRVVR